MPETGERQAEAIIRALNWGYFPRYRDSLKQCLELLENMEGNPQLAIDAAAECLREIWTVYFDEKTASIFKGFAQVQRALFGLEYEEGSPRRYREHVLHLFHVFVMGGRFLSPVLQGEPTEVDSRLRTILKVAAEPQEIGNWAGWTPYNAPRRLFYLWTLMSTFHDIGIPVQHLTGIHKGMNRYLDYFGRDLAEFWTYLEPSVTSQLQYYFGLMGRMFNNRVCLDQEHPGRYVMKAGIHPYLYKSVAQALSGDDPDHGVVSALCLYRSIERAFMQDRAVYNLDLDQFSEYSGLVLEQDVTRAALGIAFHNLKPQSYPKLFPVAFSDFPLTYLLLLSDELQEFYRLEGIRPLGVIPLPDLPQVQSRFDPAGPRIHLEVSYLYHPPSADVWDDMKRNADAFAKEVEDEPYQNHRQLVSRLWTRTTSTLRKKLLFGDQTIVHVRVHVRYQDAGHTDEVGLFDSDEV